MIRRQSGICEWLDNRSRTIRASNPRSAKFAEVMAKHITSEIYAGIAFWNIAKDAFPQTTIAEKLAFDTWQAFLFSRDCKNALEDC
ncbi:MULTISPECIES: hypothetical protein [unclassified Gluconobacter]|uniref:hypothetical protein n=1 Tax=unclassified Gluconobacter TaxID=2644261 RepID=UPI001C04ED5F|nr:MULTISPECIES: hypothetical protein [unclassified Gluconobacter]